MRKSRKIFSFLIATALMVIVAGCVPTEPAPTPSVSIPRATVSAIGGPAIARIPAPVFGGDCDAIATAEEVGDILGVAVSSPTRLPAEPEWVALMQINGTDCGWLSSFTDGASIGFVALPASALSVESDSEPTCYGADSSSPDGNGACSFTVIDGYYIFSGVVHTRAGTTNVDAQVATERFLALVKGRAAPWGEPQRPTESDALDWPKTIDCVLLEERSAARSVLASPTLEIVQDGFGLVRAEAPPVLHLTIPLVGFSSCGWAFRPYPGPIEEVGEFVVTILAGGSWNSDRIKTAADATNIELPGVGQAYVVVDEVSGSTQLHVFESTNWLVLSPLDRYTEIEDYYPVAVALVAGLNSMR